MNKKIYLVGFMGSGKSSVAKVMRAKFGLEYADTDKLIMDEIKMSISEYFKLYGEDKFRELETKILREASKSELYQVISCGGGIVMRDENIRIMKENGIVVWLKCNPKTILKRVKRNNNRPVLEGKKNLEAITQMMESRRPYYEKASDLVILEGCKSLYKTCKEIIDKVYV